MSNRNVEIEKDVLRELMGTDYIEFEEATEEEAEKMVESAKASVEDAEVDEIVKRCRSLAEKLASAWERSDDETTR